MQNDHNVLHSANNLLMNLRLSRSYSEDDVEAALAEAAAIRQATEENVQSEDAAQWCQNPFCRSVLYTFYASYCERAMCQLHRGLKLQCQANAEAAALQEMRSNRRSNSFLVLRTSSSVEATQGLRAGIAEDESKEKETCDPDAPFVIPRRKRPSATMNKAPPRAVTARTNGRAADVGTAGPSSRKRPRLGHRMHFNEVLSHFEPQVPTVPALAVSSQMRVQRIQQASRWRRGSRKSRPLRVSHQAGSSGDGGCLAQSMMQSRGNTPFVSRPAYKPQPTMYAATRRTTSRAADSGTERPAKPKQFPSRHTEACNQPSQVASSLPTLPPPPQNTSLVWPNPHSSYVEHAEASRLPCEYYRPRHNSNPRWLNPDVPRLNQEYQRSGFEHTIEDIDGLDGSNRRNDSESSCGRRRDNGEAAYNNSYEGNRMDVRGNRIVDDTVDTRCAVPDEREEIRWPSSLHSNSLSFRKETRASDAEQRNESDYNIVDLTVDQSDEDSTIRTESNTADADCEPSFSFNDPFLQHLLSKFIQDLPIQLKPVMNCTKKPRKMSWYIKYARKIERICQPHVHVQMGKTRVTIMVENRVWLKLKGSPTVDLLKKMIKSMRDEAISWREFKSEVEKCLEIYRNRLGDDVDLADVFLRAWNNIKDRTIEFSLPRGTHYFCGARFHHWSFNVGKIEIGSGSHEDKREAFRLAAASAAGFLLGLDDGRNEHRWRPPLRDTSEASDDCEFCFGRDVNSESVPRAATAAATNLIDSPDSATGDVSGTDLAIPQSDHVKNEIKPSCQFDESAIIVISSDSEDTLDNDSAMMVASSLVPAAPAIDTPSNEHVKGTEAAPTRRCNMCEIIRLRKPDSAGCRQCQLANKHCAGSSVATRQVLPSSTSRAEATSAETETETETETEVDSRPAKPGR